MPWLQVSLEVSPERQPEVEAAMEAAGAQAVTTADAGDDPVLEPGPGATPLWAHCQVTGLFDSAARPAPILAALHAAWPDLSPSSVRFSSLDDQDWTTTWAERFAPMRFGRRLWVAPPDFQAPGSEDRVVRLLPGLAFGTGTHPTTALCLEWLEARDLEGAVVVDYGCGSGILGLAAACLGASRVDAVDNDPQALQATRRNAQDNAVSDRVRCVDAGDLAEGGADLVLANILAGPLMDLAPRLAGLLRPGASLALAGLLDEQADALVQAYSRWLRPGPQRRLDGWTLLTFRG